MSLLVAKLFIFIAAGVALVFAAYPAGAQELNALVWCDHSDPRCSGPSRRPMGSRSTSRNSKAPSRPCHCRAVEARRLGCDGDRLDRCGRGVEKVLSSVAGRPAAFAEIFAEVTMDQHTKIDGKRYGSGKIRYNTIGFNNQKSIRRTCRRSLRCRMKNTRANCDIRLLPA